MPLECTAWLARSNGAHVDGSLIVEADASGRRWPTWPKWIRNHRLLSTQWYFRQTIHGMTC